ncbi:MAG TPA: nucleotidyltransferase family protein [Pyrinomonadaceae bacterium]
MKREPEKRTRGQLIAELLSASWRDNAEEPAITAEELEEIKPLLLGSGAAALAWRRIRGTDLQHAAPAEDLERAFHRNLIETTFQEQQIEKVFGLLRGAGVEAILVKGWAVARCYPERGLRPCGDIDLIIHPEQRDAAREVLLSEEGKRYFVDFKHEEFEELDVHGWDELYARSCAVQLGAESIRLLSTEDHLRFLCIHLLRHGAWRPLWLCDVAVMLETRSSEFDWERFSGKGKREADWVLCALGLAHKLLGARVSDTPAGARASKIPAWLVQAVLKQWEKPCLIDHLPPELIMVSLRHPSRVVKALKARWPDPIEATIRMGGPMNGLPRLPFQVGGYVAKTKHFMTRLPKLVREQE